MNARTRQGDRKNPLRRGKDKRGRRAEPISLGEGLQKAIARLGIENKLREHRVLLLWPQVVGARVAGVTRADLVRRGELLVAVTQDVWRHRLIFERETIRKRLNEAVGAEVIRSIRFIK